MGKRSQGAGATKFERQPRDFYPTPYDAVLPLLGHLPRRKGAQAASFIEPCAGDGRLVGHLQRHGMRCAYASDLEPQVDWVKKRDALYFPEQFPLPAADMIITNPPWDRDVLHKMIDIFRQHLPTWLLIDANWMFTAQAKPMLKFCDKIVVIGRVKWFSNMQGMDDSCWFHFVDHETKTTFIP